jgi:hypothetical protein
MTQKLFNPIQSTHCPTIFAFTTISTYPSILFGAQL